MGLAGWLVLLAVLATLAFWLAAVRRRWLERQRAADARLADLAAQIVVPKPSAPAAAEKLLFDAAAKAGEAGEPVLSIRLYARLIARYPESALGSLARAAVEVQKKKLAGTRAPGTGARG